MPQVTLAELVQAAHAGQLISFPTDTVPALAACPQACQAIYAAKQRPEAKPLILMGATAADLWPYVTGTSAEKAVWRTTADQHWPGALTLVLPASDRLPATMKTDATTIGIRVPNHPIARHILALTQPLATTSVNRSGHPPLLTAAEIDAQFPEVWTLLPQELAGLQQKYRSQLESLTSSGQPSTVAKWLSPSWQVLRQGEVKLAAL